MKTSKTSQLSPAPNGIAALAYEIYEREGRPCGRDLNHWLAAEAQLLRNRAKSARASAPSRRKPK